MIQQKVLGRLAHFVTLPRDELRLKHVQHGRGRTGNVDQNQPQAAGRMGESEPGQHVSARTLANTDHVLYVQEVEHRDQLFAQQLQRWELEALGSHQVGSIGEEKVL